MADLIIYTCITDQKDTLQNVTPFKGVDYYCFSDRPFKHRVWKYQPIDRLGQQDPRRIARRYKILSHIYFPNKTTLWLDGRIALNINPMALLSKYDSDIAIRPHHTRECIYDEGDEVKKLKFDDSAIIDRQLNRYRKSGYPLNYGLFETGAILRRPTPMVQYFNSLWWAEVSSGSKRDQLSCNYVDRLLNNPVQLMDRNDVVVNRHQRKDKHIVYK